MALGTAVAAIVILAVFLTAQIISNRYHKGWEAPVELGPFIFAAVFVLFTVPHAAVANFFQATDVARLLKTTPLLFLLLGSGIALGHMLVRGGDKDMRRALALSFGILTISACLRIAGVQPRASEGAFEKQIFPFTETSHFALAFAPVLFYRCISSKGRSRSGWLVFGFVIAVVLQSLTLLTSCILTAIACRRILVVSLACLVLALGVLPFELEYFTDRLDLSGDVRNLSGLVYIQGWQLLLESFWNSFGWGVGFQQFGVHGTEVAAADAVVSITGTDGSNLLDGGFVFAKLAGELGLFGVLIGVVFLVAAVRSVRALRREVERPVVVFARCVLVGYTVDMFMRGTGYFTGSTLLAITAASILVTVQKPLGFLTNMWVHRHPVPS